MVAPREHLRPRAGHKRVQCIGHLEYESGIDQNRGIDRKTGTARQPDQAVGLCL